MRVARQQESRDVDASLGQGIHLFEQHLGINDYPGTDHRGAMGIQDPGWDQVERVPLAFDDDRVAGVVAALVADDDIGVRGQEVGDLAFAFVTPLEADEGYAGHLGPLLLGLIWWEGVPILRFGESFTRRRHSGMMVGTRQTTTRGPMPEIDTDLYQVLTLLLMLIILIVLVAVMSTLSAIRKQLDRGPKAEANTSAPTLEQSTYDYEPSVSSYEPVQTTPPVTIAAAPEPVEEATTGFVSVADVVSTQVEPTPVAAEPIPIAAQPAGGIGLRGDEPEEQPFERDGRWWFKRGDELLVYDEGTGQWIASPSVGAVAPATATTPFSATPTATAPADAGEGWKCSSCGAINGSTATSCRMCFAPR